jgi:hypothetical protein
VCPCKFLRSDGNAFAVCLAHPDSVVIFLDWALRVYFSKMPVDEVQDYFKSKEHFVLNKLTLCTLYLLFSSPNLAIPK